MNPQALKISQLMIARKWRMAVAESATGGLLGHSITQVPGSSAYFWGGVIAYANDLKIHLLNVQESSILKWGAVSSQVAQEMAMGVRNAAGTHIGVSITGIAGPGGATEIKPVGLYFIGVALPHESRIWRHVFHGSRGENNQQAAQTALEHVISILS